MLIPIDIEGEKKELYIDNELHKRIELVIKPKLNKKDYDWVWIVDGAEGSGKSVFSMSLAKVVDPSFCLERVTMTPNEFTKAVIKAGKGEAVIFDEGFTGLSSRASLTEINRLIVSLMMEMRQKNLFVIIVMPTIFLLDKYVALFRAKGLFHIYTKGGRRGRWVYFNNKSKKLLYILGKKLFSYAKPKSKFRGRFTDQYAVNEEAYRKKKAEALFNKSRSTRAETYKYQRDLLFYVLNKFLNINQVQIAHYCKKVGFKIDRSTISEILTEMNIANLKEEEEKT
jgi:hypothetical protein